MSVIHEIKSLSRTQIALFVLGGTATAVVGAVTGWKLALDRLGEQIREESNEALQEEITGAKEFYKNLYKKDTFESPQEAYAALHPEVSPEVQKATDALLAYSGGDPEKVREALNREADEEHIEEFLNSPIAPNNPDLVEVSQNVFTDAAVVINGFDYQEELKHRDPDRPYIITEREWEEDEFHYERVQYTYFAGDGVLMDDATDEELQDVEARVGTMNMMKFGHGSDDENIVFIRNVPMFLDIEVTQSTGKYATEVAGFTEDDELIHSRTPLRKFRYSDD